MKMRRLIALMLSAGMGLTLQAPWVAAAEETENVCGYVVRMKSNAAMPMSASEELQPVPYAPGCYTVDSMEQLQFYLDTGLVEVSVPDTTLELLEGGEESANTPTDPAEPNANDPMAGQQWYLTALGMDAVWPSGLDGSGVTVAVIDSGLVQGHEDLDYTHVAGHNFLGTQGYEDASAWTDDTGHGSLVSGILAAQVWNGIGVSGLSDGVELLVLRCFAARDNGTTTAGSGSVSTILSAIEYAIEQDVDVINMSFGGTNADSLAILEASLQKAADQGIILVAAAGNDGSGIYRYPAAFDCVIGVGAVGENGELYSGSQRNDSVFVTAPGVDIYGVGYQGDVLYRSDTGTSMAAPMVSALAALAKQVDKAIDNDDFRTLLQASVTDGGEKGCDVGYGWGSISASTFVQALTAPQAIDYQCGQGELPDEGNWSTTYQIGEGNQVVLPVPVRAEYDFTGWYLTEDCVGTAISAIPAGSVGTVTLYAGWTEHLEPEPQPPMVAEEQEQQMGTAAPASLDGLTEMRPYTADVAAWFIGAEAYEIAAIPALGEAKLEGSTLVYTPVAEAAGQTVTFTLRGISGENASGEVAVSVEVADLPVSDTVLAESAVAYDLHTQITGVSVEMHLYGNRLEGITAAGRTLSAGADYCVKDQQVTLSHALLNSLGTGTHILTFQFDNGRMEETRSRSFTVTVSDSTPVTPPNPGTSGGGGGGSGGGSTSVPVKEPDLELLENEHGDFYYTLDDGTATLCFEKEELEKLAEQQACLDLSGVKEIVAISVSGEDLASLASNGVELRLPSGGMAFSPALTAELVKTAEKNTVTATLRLSEDLTAEQREATGEQPVYRFSLLVGRDPLEKLESPMVLKLPYSLREGEDAVGLGAALLGEDGTLTPLTVRWDAQTGSLYVETDQTGLIVQTYTPWINPFADVAEEDWFYEAVAYVSGRGIMNGVGQQVFSPGTYLTRGMIAQVLYNLEKPAERAEEAFADVSANAWYGNAVNWAVVSGIVNGYSATIFGPDDFVTREQAATILYRYCRYKGYDTEVTGDLTEFADSDKISPWAEEAMEWAAGSSLLSGKGGKLLDPAGTATRAEVAQILLNLFQMLKM